MAELIKIVTERRMEVDVLHIHGRGRLKAKNIFEKVNGRWNQLDNLVKKYNADIRKVSDTKERQLSAKDIQANCIEND